MSLFTANDLGPLLKRLKLGNMLPTLPERVALARCDSPDYLSFLQIILSDEVNRRDGNRLQTRFQKAGFEEICRLEDFDWNADINLDRRLVDAVFSLEVLANAEHVLLVGPVGVGKSFLAQALGYAALKAGNLSAFCKGRRLLPQHGPRQARRNGGEGVSRPPVPGSADP